MRLWPRKKKEEPMNVCPTCGGTLGPMTGTCYPCLAQQGPTSAPASFGGSGFIQTQQHAQMLAAITMGSASPTPPTPEPANPRTVVGIQGWRILQVASSNPLVLVGNNGGHIVSAMTPPAKCANGCKEAPSWHCPDAGGTHGCGYYVLQDPPKNDGMALAKVSLAGRTIVHDQGWRTFRYRLDELWLPADTVDNTDIDEAEARFGCPIFVLERMLPHGDRATERRRDSGAEGDASADTADDGEEAEQGAGASRELAQ